MASSDPHPGRPFEDALELLAQRFPAGKIEHHPSNGEVFVSLPLDDGGEFQVGLTWQQAKYLAYNPVTGDELKSGRLPTDWPQG